MRINLVDVAREANVSTVTVSRAFTNPNLLASQTRHHVLQTAERLGYVPNRLARGLRNGKTHTIAVLTTDLQQRLNTLKLDQVQREIQDFGYQTLLLQYGSAVATKGSILAEVRDSIDGLVLCCLEGLPSFGEIEKLMAARVPVVSLEPCPGIDVDVVTADRAFGSWLAVQHLRRLGHTRIALGQIALSSEVVGQRRLGYENAMRDGGLTPVVLSRPGGGGSAFLEGHRLVEEALAEGVAVTAWLFSDDEMAVGGMKALAARGVRVPDDVAVIGWDDSPLCDYIAPTLTSITQPIDQTASRLVERLQLRLDGADTEARAILIRPELVVRESCGARRGRGT